MKVFPQKAQSFNQKRNEWPAFTYGDGEYLITRAPRGWVTFRSVKPDRTMLDRGGREDNARGRRVAEDMINIR